MSIFFTKIIDKAKQASQGHIQPQATAPGLPLSPPGSSQNSFSNAPPKSDEDSNRMSVDESDFQPMQLSDSMPPPSTIPPAKPTPQQPPPQPTMAQPDQPMVLEQQQQERLTPVTTPNSPPLTPTTPTVPSVPANVPVSSNPSVTITELHSTSPPSTHNPTTTAAPTVPAVVPTASTSQQSNGGSVGAFNDAGMIAQRQSRPKLKLADFHLLRTLGTGSFGRVHLSQSRVNHRFYAIKVLKKSEVVRLKQVEHTNNEKHILEKVAHPFLVNLWGTFQDDGNLYMVMDYVPGGELFSVLRKSQRFPDHVAKFYAAEVILAIEYLHSKDTIYRDLKPENLLLDAQGHIKITDFGFAKHVPDITWTLCGTPDYLAPEIIQSKGYGKAVDWYSLGVLIFEMLAGYPPFYDDDHLKLYEKILLGKVKWPSYFDPWARDLLKRLLTPDLSKRFGNLKGGSDDIKRHRWFDGVDFNKVLRREIRAPYVPQIRGEGDASHFDRYPEESEPYGQAQSDPYREKFPDF